MLLTIDAFTSSARQDHLAERWTVVALVPVDTSWCSLLLDGGVLDLTDEPARQA
jgi:hypothetical protein